MPVLSRKVVTTGGEGESSSGHSVLDALAGRAGFFSGCANPVCDSGWLHLWRSRSAPIFEGGWSCSPECTRATVAVAVQRELDGRVRSAESHRHRIPLGLVMLEQGWITAQQLREAVDAQKTAGGGRLGQWLIRRQGVSEQFITRALGLQWSAPVLSLDYHDPQAAAPLLPRFFLNAFTALPLRVAAGRLIYLGFEDRIDPVLALAIERMTGLRAECGLVRESSFRAAHERMLGATFPAVDLVETASEPMAARAIARAVERARPIESRLARVHGCLWLRMWRRAQAGTVPDAAEVQDLICTPGAL
jgi:hypothetical protein